jgi:phenylacetate-CoA ligase
MFHFLHRFILLPVYETGLKRRKIFRYWKDLERSQWLSLPVLERLQFERLQLLLNHARQTCPYYRNMWSRLGLSPGSLQSREEFLQWPIIDRETIRENRIAMRSQLAGMKFLAKSTGGSTGMPLSFDYDAPSLDWRYAAWHRGYNWAGAGPGTKQFYFWGIPLGQRTPWKDWKDHLYNWLYRRLVVSSFDFREDKAPEILRQLQRFRPDTVIAYTNPLYIFARCLEEQKLKPYRPKSLVVGAEKLHGFQRELIERVFQAPVFETYGSREFTLMAAECDRHRGLHLSMENYFFEIVDDKGRPTPDGQEGNVVITDLNNYGLPFVRYRNGDRAVAGWSTCSCGRGLPLLQGIVGRQLDMLQTPDGRLIPGEFFPHLLKDFPAIRRFQVIQEEPDRIQLHVVLNGTWSERDQQLLDREVRKVIGPVIQFDFLPVDHIDLTAAGKLQVVINRCRNSAILP